MRYSEIKERIQVLRLLGYEKMAGMGYYQKIFRYGEYGSIQCLSSHELTFQVDFRAYLLYLENKNMNAIAHELWKGMVERV